MKYYSIATWYLCISIHFDSENLKPQLVKHLDSLVRFQGVGAGGGEALVSTGYIPGLGVGVLHSLTSLSFTS